MEDTDNQQKEQWKRGLTMGLLSKATSISERVQNREQNGRKSKGLLTKAAQYSQSQAHTGLMEKAAQLGASEESGVEEAEQAGLLRKAQALSESGKEGLLKKAEIIAEEREGLLEKVEVIEEAGKKESLRGRARKAGTKGAAKEKAKDTSVAEGTQGYKAPAETRGAAEKKRKKSTRAGPRAEKEKEKTPDRLVRKHLSENNVIALLELCRQTERDMGHEALVQLFLKTAIDLCKAQSGVLLSLQRGRYRVEEIFYDRNGKKFLEKLSFREGSKLIRLMKKRWGELFELDMVKNELSKRDTRLLEPLMPLMFVPLVAGMRLIGFFIIGNNAKKTAVEQKSLLLLSHISASFISEHIFEAEMQTRDEELSKQREESESLLALYDYMRDESNSVANALERLSALFHIETAVLVTGWDTRGGLQITDGIGVTEEEKTRFKLLKGDLFAKKDRELLDALKKGEPKVPKDVAKRISALSEELEREFKTYITVPVSFHGLHLAILVILNMKGAGKKLSKTMKLKLKSISGILVPYILYEKLLDTDPYLGFEFCLEREIKESEGSEYPLHIVIGTVTGTPKVMKDEEFKRYRRLYDRLYRICQEIVAGSGRVSMVSWKRIVLFIRAVQPENVDGIVNHIRERFAQVLKKEKQKHGLTFKKVSYRSDRTGFYELLSMVY
jgi:hypothetical protein